MSEETRKELMKLIETAVQLDRTGLILMRSNAEVLLARDRLAQKAKKEKESAAVA